MTLANILNSEMILSLTAAAAGLLWTALKGSDWFERVRQQRLDRAVLALEAAVEETYRDYVRALKSASEDGSLSPEEQRQARVQARERAVAIARAQGLDLAAILGSEYIDLWIGRLVKRLKR